MQKIFTIFKLFSTSEPMPALVLNKGRTAQLQGREKL
jgi:hypothetical protein